MAAILQDEEVRQRSTLALIASENYASVAVRQASGSILTNKYSEGYPGKRYYAGNELVDTAEALAIERVKELFGAEHANVQPHAGSQANMAAYFATLNPGDTVLAMELAQGGHLTHGAGFNFSGKLYRFVHYGVRRDTETLDYDEIEAIAPKAVAFKEAAQPEFRTYQQQVVRNCQALAAEMARQGARVVSGGTDNHLFLLDLTPLGLEGQEGSSKAELAGLIVNKNLIPFDPLPSTRTSGLRVGTACVTTRGLGTEEMAQVGSFLYRALTAPDEEALHAIAEEVRAMLDDFPAPFLGPLGPEVPL